MARATPGAWLVLLALGAAGCAEVLGLDEPTIRDGGATGSTGSGGDAATTSSTAGSTGADTTTTSTASTGGDGGGGAGGGAGGAPPQPCRSDAECEDDDPCDDDTCGEDGLCQHEDLPDGPLGVDDPSDCIDRVCAGGREVVVPDDTEDPPDPVPVCDTRICAGGRVEQLLADEGVSCGPDPLACDGEGSCGGCTVDEECGAPTECSNPTCDVGTGLCDPGYITGNLPDVVDGDCQRPTCNGSSPVATSIADDADNPSPLPPCTRSCSSGALRNGLEGTSCDNGGGSAPGVCSGLGMGTDACKSCRETSANPDPGCGAGTPRCDEDAAGGEGSCVFCLVSDHCIGNISGPLCRADGFCGCTLDSQCASSPAGASCTPTQTCGCESDADCNTSSRGRSCNSGVCGCDTSNDCTGLNGDACISSTSTCGCVNDADCATGYYCDSPPTCSF